MEQSENLLVALKKMLAMKTAVVEPTASLEPTPSTSALKRPHVADESSPTKKRRVEHTVKKSIGNTFATIPIQVIENMDMNEFFKQCEG